MPVPFPVWVRNHLKDNQLDVILTYAWASQISLLTSSSRTAKAIQNIANSAFGNQHLWADTALFLYFDDYLAKSRGMASALANACQYFSEKVRMGRIRLDTAEEETAAPPPTGSFHELYLEIVHNSRDRCQRVNTLNHGRVKSRQTNNPDKFKLEDFEKAIKTCTLPNYHKLWYPFF